MKIISLIDDTSVQHNVISFDDVILESPMLAKLCSHNYGTIYMLNWRKNPIRLFYDDNFWLIKHWTCVFTFSLCCIWSFQSTIIQQCFILIHNKSLIRKNHARDTSCIVQRNKTNRTQLKKNEIKTKEQRPGLSRISCSVILQ